MSLSAHFLPGSGSVSASVAYQEAYQQKKIPIFLYLFNLPLLIITILRAYN